MLLNPETMQLCASDGEYTQLEGGGLQRDGFGSHVTSDGLQYTGNWLDDKMNGKGEHTTNDISIKLT